MAIRCGQIVLLMFFFFTFTMAESDEDIARGNERRRQHFFGKNDTDAQKMLKKMNSSYWWSNEGCRVLSDMDIKECFLPSSSAHCWDYNLDYKYTRTNGAFPKHLEFLRIFPNCWELLSPQICNEYYRPCEISRKNDAANLYVQRAQFSQTICERITQECHFAIKHILKNYPDYLNCTSQTKQSNEQIIYRKECKLNTLNIPPVNSYQCIWPLIKYREPTKKPTPLIDKCYLPCETPIYHPISLGLFKRFIGTFYLLTAILVIVISMTFTAFLSHHFHGIVFCISASVVVELLIITVSTWGMGELSICIGNENNGRIRCQGLQGDGWNIFICVFQAIILDFCLFYRNWSILVLFAKRSLYQLRNYLPKWNILPLFTFVLASMFAFIDLLTAQMDADPVRKVCHFSSIINRTHSGHVSSLMYYLIFTLICFFVVLFNNANNHRNKVNNMRKRRHNNNRGRNYNFPQQQDFLRQQEISVEATRATAEDDDQNLTQQLTNQNGFGNNSYLQYYGRLLQQIHQNLFVFLVCYFVLSIAFIFFNCFVINSDEENSIILDSIRCSINHTLGEGLSMDWINQTAYKTITVTNPHIRRQLLKGITSAPSCGIEYHSLILYWITMFLLLFEIFLSAIIILAVAMYGSDYLHIEQEYEKQKAEEEEKKLASVEMLERRVGNAVGKRRRHNFSNVDNGLSDEYERISFSSISTTRPEIEAEQQIPNLPLPPQLPTVPVPSTNNDNNKLITDEAGNKNYLPISYSSEFSTYCPSVYSFPLDWQQQQWRQQQMQQLFQNTYKSAGISEMILRHFGVVAGNENNRVSPNIYGDLMQRWLQQLTYAATNTYINDAGTGCNDAHYSTAPTATLTTCNNVSDKNEKSKYRKRAGSDPVDIRHLRQQRNGQQPEVTGNQRRRRKLHIKGPPKELQREWRKEEQRKMGEKKRLGNNRKQKSTEENCSEQRRRNEEEQPRRSNSRASNSTSEVNSDELCRLYEKRYGLNNPNAIANTAAEIAERQQQQIAANMQQQQLLQILSSFLIQPPPPYYWPPLTATTFSLSQQQQLILMELATLIASNPTTSQFNAGNSMLLQQNHNENIDNNNDRNFSNDAENEEHEEAEDEEDEEEAENQEEDIENDSEEDATNTITSDSSTSLLPSSSCSEIDDDINVDPKNDSDYFDSDSENSLEEKQWEERAEEYRSVTKNKQQN